MKEFLHCTFFALALLSASQPLSGANFYVSPTGGNVAPFTDWPIAATNIQDAIDVASAGDVVWVTNGTYFFGGKTNGVGVSRVALDKAVTVQSANGPLFTIVEGKWEPGATNGASAVRCAWLTNGATLSGFTLRGGATQPQQTGGGVYGTALGATVTNCFITGNAAGSGGGATFCTLINCFIAGNWALSDSGGGAFHCTLKNCGIIRNSAKNSGGGADHGTLVNCTVARNWLTEPFSSLGGGVSASTLNNCIICSNRSSSAVNYNNCSLTFSCSLPLPSGTGNITLDPQLLADDVHLSPNSPCRGTGTPSAIAGTDIDGQPWANPPSMGCDEWSTGPVFAGQPQAHAIGAPVALTFGPVIAAGQAPFAFSWSKGGLPLDEGLHYSSVHSASLTVRDFGPGDAGGYQVVISNAFGMVTSQVVEVFVRCVSAASLSGVLPFSDWTTAAANIQDAIDAAATGDFILVTNGIYSAGGRVVVGDLTNRVALTRPLTVTSVNGSAQTIIKGIWDPTSTNGPLAVRCAWVGDGSLLNGFTLEGGATRTNGDSFTLQCGGGLWAASTNPIIVNCLITNNSAYYYGGGCCLATLNNCSVRKNWSGQAGGGGYSSMLANCLVKGNYANLGGGVAFGTLLNCTVTENSASTSGGGIYGGNSTNSIIYYNSSAVPTVANFALFPILSYSCTSPSFSGTSNLFVDPQLLDGIHLTSTSPCRSAGNPLYSSGYDIDNEPWANPPSIGCDEFWESGIGGPLSVHLSAVWPAVAQGKNLPLFAEVVGRASRAAWSYGDASTLTNASYLTTYHAWTNPGDYTVTFTAFNVDHPAGVSTNVVVHVLPLLPPILSAGGFSGNSFRLSFQGQPGVTYIAEQTTNLASPAVWQTVSTLFATDTNLLQLNDAQATNDIRFYRVRIR